MKHVRRLTQPLRPPKCAAARLLMTSVLVAGLLAACTFNPSRPDASQTSRNERTAVCFQKVVVQTGRHEIPAFNDASTRAMETALAKRGYSVSCDNSDKLNLSYSMTFDAQTLMWEASMTVTDAKGATLYTGSENDAIGEHGAFQYTTEVNAETLVLRFLQNHSRP